MNRFSWFILALPLILILIISWYLDKPTPKQKTAELYTNDIVYLFTSVRQQTEFGKLIVHKQTSTKFKHIGSLWQSAWKLDNITSKDITVNLDVSGYFHALSLTEYVKHTNIPKIITIPAKSYVTLSVLAYIHPTLFDYEFDDAIVSKRAYMVLRVYNSNTDLLENTEEAPSL